MSVREAQYVTMQNIINCYIREMKVGQWYDTHTFGFQEEALVVSFLKEDATLYIPVKYKSVTGRHRFGMPMYYSIEKGTKRELDPIILLRFIERELDGQVGISDLVVRMILSYQNICSILACRKNDLNLSYEKTFLEAEQSLLLGHTMHPTPKSRQGMTEEEENVFSPERKGSFQLHYFIIANEFIEQDHHGRGRTYIQEDIQNDDCFDKSLLMQVEEVTFVPMHPLQAKTLLGKAEVIAAIRAGKITYIGPQGRSFYATSSVRTVYHPQAAYMYKFSIPVKITNSLRVNKRKELVRGVEVSDILAGGLKQKLEQKHPYFHIIEDPAYITVRLNEEESGFETVLRENPFQGTNKHRTTLLAALCQDGIGESSALLTHLIAHVAKQEAITVQEASKRWLSKYLQISLQPMYWLYETHGIVLEAHQQNSLIQMDDKGYPHQFYYRDNQGYYFMASKAERLKEFVVDLNKESDTICSDDVAVERFRYYFFFNHLFGLIHAFGSNNLIEEEVLLHVLREELEKLPLDKQGLLQSLLYEPTLPCKANLLTRFHDMDELVGELATQSVYVETVNPLAEVLYA